MNHRPGDNDLLPAGDPQAAASWRGLGDLVSLATERLARPVEDMHRVIADRWFDVAGPQVAPLRRRYHAFTAGIYASVRMAGAVLGNTVGAGAEAAGRRNRLRPVGESPFGSGVQAIANAVWGDELEHRQSDLRIELGLRDGSGRPIGSRPDALARAFPEATNRLVVLVHGLGETERCWRRNPTDGTSPVGLADVLTADSFAPLLVRYNTGLHVSDNGRALATLLEDVSTNWPLPVEEIALVGNSMGGLVVRSAVLAGSAEGHQWVSTVRHLVTVGAPHLGAPLEKGVNLMSWGSRLAPESRPVGEFLEKRSSGIKDLRFGAIREEDWPSGDGETLFDSIDGDQLFPAHLQQLDMESNGKSVNRRGEAVSYPTGPIVFGEPGTNGQHSFYQLLHQGTDVVPLQFVGFRESQAGEDVITDGSTSQTKLNANLAAQIIAFAKGSPNDNPNKNFDGMRPSTLLTADRLDARVLGALLAHYENKVMFQGFCWNLNSFDQEGVQLGKKLAKSVLEGSSADGALKAYAAILGVE